MAVSGPFFLRKNPAYSTECMDQEILGFISASIAPVWTEVRQAYEEAFSIVALKKKESLMPPG